MRVHIATPLRYSCCHGQTELHTNSMRTLCLAIQCTNLLSSGWTHSKKIKENVPPRLHEHTIKIFSVEYNYRSHFNYTKHYQCYRILMPYKVLARWANDHVLILNSSSFIGFRLWHCAQTSAKWSFWHYYVTCLYVCVLNPFCVTFHNPLALLVIGIWHRKTTRNRGCTRFKTVCNKWDTDESYNSICITRETVRKTSLLTRNFL